MVVMYALNAIRLLRISPEGESYGLDLTEHGISAYPEYVISSIGRPSGMRSESSSPALGTQPIARIGLSESAHERP
jgi:Amt family ammonium transporter